MKSVLEFLRAEGLADFRPSQQSQDDEDNDHEGCQSDQDPSAPKNREKRGDGSVLLRACHGEELPRVGDGDVDATGKS